MGFYYTEQCRIEYIRDGFTKTDGYFQTNVDHRTQKLTLSVVFPSERKPFEILLVEQHAERTTVLGADHLRQLPNGNWTVHVEHGETQAVCP